jgi:hypothetical protein
MAKDGRMDIPSKAYKENYDRIFGKSKPEKKVEEKTKINEEWKAACDAAIRSDSWWVY